MPTLPSLCEGLSVRAGAMIMTMTDRDNKFTDEMDARWVGCRETRNVQYLEAGY